MAMSLSERVLERMIARIELLTALAKQISSERDPDLLKEAVLVEDETELRECAHDEVLEGLATPRADRHRRLDATNLIHPRVESHLHS